MMGAFMLICDYEYIECGLQLLLVIGDLLIDDTHWLSRTREVGERGREERETFRVCLGVRSGWYNNLRRKKRQSKRRIVPYVP